MEESTVKISGTEFYDSIKENGPLPLFYGAAENRYFDLYEIGGKLSRAASSGLRYLHNGLLATYLFWYFLGAVLLLFFLVR